jgi:hypothetical protein
MLEPTSTAQRGVDVRRQALPRLLQLRKTSRAALGIDTLALITSPDIPSPAPLTARTKEPGEDFYLTFPYLFYEQFPRVPVTHYDSLALSNALYLDFVLLTDRLMDGKVRWEPSVAFWVTSAYQEVSLILSQLFARDSSFWDDFDAHRRERIEALQIERLAHLHRIVPYTEEEKIAIAAGKSAMAKATIAALAYLAEQVAPTALLASCEAYHVGLQLLDNLQDWRSDYRDHLYTPLLTQVILDNGLENDVESAERPNVNLIGTLIYTHGYYQRLLTEAQDYFKLALYYVQEATCPAWQHAVETMLQHCREAETAKRKQLARIREKQRQPKATSASRAPSPSTPPPLTYDYVPIYQAFDDGEDGYRTKHRALLTAFHQATGGRGDKAANTNAIKVLSEHLHDAADLCDGILRRCHEQAPYPETFSLYLLVADGDESVATLHHDDRCTIAINLAAAPLLESTKGNRQTLRNFLSFRITYGYGRMLRGSHHAPTRVLDRLCLEGMGLAFAVALHPDAPWEALAEVPPGTQRWFEHNKHYLWQEIEPFLSSTVEPSQLFRASNSAKKTHVYRQMVRTLGYDMVQCYLRRSGQTSWPKLAKTPALEILNKGAAMTVASQISGQKNVRFDV